MINLKLGEIAAIGVDSAAKLKPRRLKLMAHDRARSWPSIPLHDRVKRPEISGLIFSLKPCILPSFVLQLCDSPAFRLDSEGIGAGLIANSSLISSNFPLEFRKSVRKDPSKFTPIRANWSLILVAIGLVVRFDRLSRGNLSFY